MQRTALAMLAIVVGYWEFHSDLDYWLPAFCVVYGGYVVGQSVILAVLAAIVFGCVVTLLIGARVLRHHQNQRINASAKEQSTTTK